MPEIKLTHRNFIYAIRFALLHCSDSGQVDYSSIYPRFNLSKDRWQFLIRSFKNNNQDSGYFLKFIKQADGQCLEEFISLHAEEFENSLMTPVKEGKLKRMSDYSLEEIYHISVGSRNYTNVCHLLSLEINEELSVYLSRVLNCSFTTLQYKKISDLIRFLSYKEKKPKADLSILQEKRPMPATVYPANLGEFFHKIVSLTEPRQSAHKIGLFEHQMLAIFEQLIARSGNSNLAYTDLHKLRTDPDSAENFIRHFSQDYLEIIQYLEKQESKTEELKIREIENNPVYENKALEKFNFFNNLKSSGNQRENFFTSACSPISTSPQEEPQRSLYSNSN